jgi:DNA-binding CsgD family transcriptional regulator
VTETIDAPSLCVEIEPGPDPSSLLVIAQRPGTWPAVVLASGSFETSSERVFFRGTTDNDVLRLPLETPYAVRSTRRAATAPAPQPEGPEPADTGGGTHQASPLDALLEQELAVALQTGDSHAAEQLAALMGSRLGLRSMYLAMSRSLQALGSSSQGSDREQTLVECIASEASLVVCERLRSRCPQPTQAGVVLLASPPGDRNTLALRALAHQVQDAGRRVQIVEDLPLIDLCEAVTRPDTLAVVLNLRLPMKLASLRRMVRKLRAAAPTVFLVVGGPGVPPGTQAIVDLVTDEPLEAVTALKGHLSGLTCREREVLAAVAEGMTTHEVAKHLGLSSSTVKTHVDHVLTKTGTSQRSAAVAHALREGWLS